MNRETRIPFENLAGADLILDAIYEGGVEPTLASDPLARLLPCGNQGGFRAVRTRARTNIAMAVLFSTGADPDWPDAFDADTGLFVYYGDNKRPGKALGDTVRGGNALLRNTFAAVHADPPQRESVPPFLVFTKAGEGRDVQFRGLAVPGSDRVTSTEDLVAIWRTARGQRFQNYRAVFSILDVPAVSRDWIASALAGEPDGPECPEAFREWLATGRYNVLAAPRVLEYRDRQEQLPATDAGWGVIRAIHSRFKNDPFGFEECAARLWQMMAGEAVTDWNLTRPVRDGGRDAIGHFAIGPAVDRILLDFAIEAKCYEPGTSSVGVRDAARLISRLRHRQFGVLATTSFVHYQAYQEIRQDGHPVVIISARDIVELLAQHDISSMAAVQGWLDSEF